MSVVEVAALFGPTTDPDIEPAIEPALDRTIDGAAYRPTAVADLVLSTGKRHRFDQPVIIGRPSRPVIDVVSDANEPCGHSRVDVAHPMLSREHAYLSPVGRRTSVIDLGSTNGTVVVAPNRPPIICRPHRLVLVDAGWMIEFGGAIWATVESQPGAETSDDDGSRDAS